MNIAVIDENNCIGCNLCAQVCPIDAIIGTRKYLHTVLIEECIGCKLCLPVCPVDCISLSPLENTLINKPARAEKAKQRYRARNLRLAAQQQSCLPVFDSAAERSQIIKAEILAVLERAKK